MPPLANFKTSSALSSPLVFSLWTRQAAPGHHLDDAVLLPEEVARGFDAMTAEVVHGAAAGFLDVPEVGAVRPAVRFPRAHPKHAAD